MTLTVTDLPERMQGRIQIGDIPHEPFKTLETPCWVWIGGKFPAGYGCYWLDAKSRLVHRVVWELLIGPLPGRDGDWLDHVCRVRACCRPDHLELVSPTENQLRRLDSRPATHCANGHLWASNEASVKGKPNQRVCRACGVERQRRHRANKQAITA